MKAVQIDNYGGPEAMSYREVPDPSPGEGEAVVDVQAVGVNFTDTYSRAGVNPVAGLPWTVGVEAAGVIRSIGSGVSEVNVGDEVAFCTVPGCYAGQVLAPAWRLIKRPAGLDARAGAAAMLQGMTAHYLCYSTYPVQPEDRVLIHAGAGGMGLLLTQMVKHLGGYVFTTVSTEAKAELSREAGADQVILYTQQDFAEEVKKTTNGKGVQVVYDAVGLTTFDQSISCLAPRGHMVLYGAASGAPPPVNTAVLGRSSLSLTRPGLGHYTATRGELEKRSGDVLGWVQSGQLKLRIDHEFPLTEAAEAHRQLEGRATTGKVLLIP